MHKGVILLTKAQDKDEALANVSSFLQEYGDGKVWDWFVIGGRWSGTLNPKAKEFFNKAEEHFKLTYPDRDNPFLSMKMVEEQAEPLRLIWSELLGADDLNPYARSSYERMGYDDDVLPLTECIEVVKDWTKDMNAHAEEMWEKMVAAKSGKDGHDMSGYYANRYGEAKYDAFCFDSNVYLTDDYTNNPASALENADQYYAVMVDMHN
jgi:hypothetical protein